MSYTLGEAIISSGNSTDNSLRITGGFQQPGLGKIVKGTVNDACSGLPLSKVTVKLESPNDSIQSDVNGSFGFEIFSTKDTFQYSFQKTGNKVIEKQSYSGNNLKVNLGRVVDTSINITVCQANLPYKFKDKSFSKTTDTIITISKPNSLTPDTERCDSIFRLKIKVDLVRHDTIDTVICSHNTFILPRARRSVSLTTKLANDTPLYYKSGCDSVTTIYRISVYTSPIKADTQYACLGETLRYRNKVFTSQNPIAYDTIKGGAKYGCDSVIRIVAIFSNIKTLPDEYTIKFNGSVDTTINVLQNDMINGKYTLLIKDSIRVGSIKVVDNKYIQLKIPKNPLSINNFSYQICSELCPAQCDVSKVEITQIKGDNDLSGGEPILLLGNAPLVFEGIENFPNRTLTIVNRWGQQVFYAKPYNNDWFGTNQRNERLPDGTYFYAVNFEITDGKVQWGSVTLVKE